MAELRPHDAKARHHRPKSGENRLAADPFNPTTATVDPNTHHSPNWRPKHPTKSGYSSCPVVHEIAAAEDVAARCCLDSARHDPLVVSISNIIAAQEGERTFDLFPGLGRLVNAFDNRVLILGWRASARRRRMIAIVLRLQHLQFEVARHNQGSISAKMGIYYQVDPSGLECRLFRPPCSRGTSSIKLDEDIFE